VKLVPAISRVANYSEARKPNGGVTLVYNEITRRQDDSEMSTMKRRTLRDNYSVREHVAIS